MKKLIFLLPIFVLLQLYTHAQQVGIGTAVPDASAKLDVSSTTQGFLPPRMTTVQRDAISSPATGLLIYNTTTHSLEFKSSTGWVSPNTARVVSYPPFITVQDPYVTDWTEKNLEVTNYRNGDIIPYVADPATWSALTTGAWCYYNNDPVNGAIYGKLYNWYAVNDPRGLAPIGCFIPYSWSFGNLLYWLSLSGGSLKTTGTTRWASPNTGATNSIGFSALPGGWRSSNGDFSEIGLTALWWTNEEWQYSSTQALTFSVVYNSNAAIEGGHCPKNLGLSVRCYIPH